MAHQGGNIAHNATSIEVVEDLIPIGPVEISLRLPGKVTETRLVPSGRKLKITQSAGRIEFRVPRFACHTMVEVRM